METFKLICVAQTYNENKYHGWDGKTNLERFMESVSQYCDALVLYDDGSIDTTKKFVSEFTKTRSFSIVYIDGGSNDFINEQQHKARLLDEARKCNADVVLWLDIDEIFERDAECGGLRQLAWELIEKNIDAANFYQKNLWRTNRFVRVDELWAAGLFCRLWRMTPPLTFNRGAGLHQQPYPNGIRSIVTSPLAVIHYGFADTDSILRKYKVYKEHGQNGRTLERLLDERGLKVNRVNPNWFNGGILYGPGQEVYNTPLVECI